MKILLINQAFVSPNEPGHTRHYELAQYLKSQGHELIIVASDINYQTGERIVEHKGIFTEQDINGIRVMRTYIYPALHKSFFWRIISFISFMFTSFWAAMQSGPVDVVMGTSPPIFQAATAWAVAFLRRKPFLLEIRDLWPAFAVDMGVLKNPLIIKLASWLERFLYNRASQILVNSPAYKTYMTDMGVSASKVTFIPYGTDVDQFNPTIDGQSIRQELGLDDKFIVGYTGALGLANDIDTVLRAAERLKDTPAIQIVFFGDGKERARLEAEKVRMGLDNVTFAGTKPKTQMPEVVAACDACLAILKNIPMFGMTYPNKVFDYMAAGKPTILVIDGVVRDVIEQADAGIFVQPGDDTALADAIRSAYEQPERTKEMGENARQAITSQFDRRDKIAENLALFQQLVGARA